MVTVSIDELPRENGFPVGRYRVRYDTVSVTMFDCSLVDGVTPKPVTGRTVTRLHAAYGSACSIEPWDASDAECVAAHLEATGRHARAAALRGQAPAWEPAQAAEPEPSSAASSEPSGEPDIEPELVAEPVIDADVDGITDVGVLRAMAAGLGIAVDEKWKAARLRLEIRKARTQSL